MNTFKCLSTSSCLMFSSFAQICVKPPTETILVVPITLSVTNQNQFVYSHLPRFTGQSRQGFRAVAMNEQTCSYSSHSIWCKLIQFYCKPGFGLVVLSLLCIQRRPITEVGVVDLAADSSRRGLLVHSGQGHFITKTYLIHLP